MGGCWLWAPTAPNSSRSRQRAHERSQAMKTFSMMMLVLVMLVVNGCAGGVEPATVAPTVDVTGTWAGTWVGAELAIGTGPIEMALKQTGSEYTGNLFMTSYSI